MPAPSASSSPRWWPSSRSFEVTFDLDHLRRRLVELGAQAAEPNLWDDPKAAQALLREQAGLRSTVESWDRQKRAVEDAHVLVELAEESADDAALTEAAAEAAKARQAVDDLELRRMLSGEHDRAAAIVNVNAGAGGVDAQDWAEMVFRMLLRYCQRKGWKTELLDEQQGEEAGFKSVTFTAEGEFAFGFLRAEQGVHRLVRISPFDSQARRHTAFAAVSVTPDIDDSIEIDIRDDDLRIDVFRSSGAGGQHVNKTESAVRITHLPTNIVVQCQNERSQHKNKATAMRMLRSKLYDLEQRKKQEKLDAELAQKKAIEWGSQIRSYVLAPYRQVNDHRTETKQSNVDAVLDGDLDELIRAYLLSSSTP
jgi:peptide chain release factor 2